METSHEAETHTPFDFEAHAAAFGLRERERIRRLLIKRKVESWVGTIVVAILAVCAVIALTNAKITWSDNPNIQGFRQK